LNAIGSIGKGKKKALREQYSPQCFSLREVTAATEDQCQRAVKVSSYVKATT